jgi:uncharacterized delta-60 repeat protein
LSSSAISEARTPQLSRLAVLTVAGLLAVAVFPAPAKTASNPLDPSFGNGGIVMEPATQRGAIFGLAEDRVGRVVAAGQTAGGNIGLLRYLADGALDTSLGGGLIETELSLQTTANDVAIRRDGKIVVAGSSLARGSPFGSFVLARYSQSGSLDRSFGKNGLAVTHVGQDSGGAFALAIQPDGRIVVAGFGERVGQAPAGLLIRYRANGKIDKSFGTDGRVSFAPHGKGEAALTDVAVLPSGKVLVSGGTNRRFLLVRLLGSGKHDPSFGGGDGLVTTDIGHPKSCACSIINSLALRPGGGAVLAGNVGENSAVARYRPNGSLDRSFGQQGFVPLRLGGVGAPSAVALQEDGRIDVSGYSESGSIKVFRYLPSGDPDPDFGNDGEFSQRVGDTSQANAALIQPGGRLVIGGRSNQRDPPSEHEFPLENDRFLLMRFLP